MYRNESARAPFWDYSKEGGYFITIDTHHKKRLFGEIVNQSMILSPIGEIVREEWYKSFNIRQELFCDAFVIMPNHLHAIVRIVVVTGGELVGTHGRASLQQSQPGTQQPQRIANTGVAYRTPKSISSFVAGFKSAATTRINAYRNSPAEPVWQSRFYDRIIRNLDDYRHIYDYIIKNPEK